MKGRVLWRDGNRLGLRTAADDRVVEPAGDAQPGDLVVIDRLGAVPERVAGASSTDFPGPDSETTRLSRQRLECLAVRAAVTRFVREYFHAEEFVEVDGPALIRAPALEVHLDAFPVGDRGDRYLSTSPEYQHKRLLAAGLERIYSVCRCFRDGESGTEHQPEFTMIEWYRAWSDLEQVLADTEALVAGAARTARGSASVEVADRIIDLTPPWPRMTVSQVMHRFAGVIGMRGDESESELAALVADAGIDVGEARRWDDIFYAAFVHKVEPALRDLDKPLVVTEWPVKLGALARKNDRRPEVVDRFEVYIGGLELCNAFGELTDAAEQRARFEQDLRDRSARGKATPPLDERLLAALAEGLPPSAGNALGLDRLVMLVTGARDIRSVIWFADDEL